jgi:ubiquinone/menaquinone biosynthesis C-methylase UbiE
VLEIGCGYGVLLEKIISSKKYGIECNEYAVGVCRNKGLNVELRTDVEEQLHYGDKVFDYVIMNEVIEHFKVPRNVVKEVARVLKPGGRIVITTPVKTLLNKNLDPSHFSEMSLEEMIRLLKSNKFEIEAHEVSGLSPFNFFIQNFICKIARKIRSFKGRQSNKVLSAVNSAQNFYDNIPLIKLMSKFRSRCMHLGTQQLVIASRI